jgi:AcrR family transcriptional regulator
MEPIRDRILDACEALIRRHGPAKVSVVDVARTLGMSHANLYRHFPSKEALREAVVERWLGSVSTPLAAIAQQPAPAPERLADWVRALAAAKEAKILAEPELFAAYEALADAHRGAVERHLAELHGQLAHILADGVAEGSFAGEAEALARAVLAATSAFHHPHMVRTAGGGPDRAAALEAVLALLLKGLRLP